MHILIEKMEPETLAVRPGCPETILPGDLDPENVIFLNIETTGLMPRRHFIYTIGILYYSEGHYQIMHLTAPHKMEERLVLAELKKILDQKKTVIAYSAKAFTLRFLAYRFNLYHDEPLLGEQTIIDLKETALKVKHLLRLDSVRKTTLITSYLKEEAPTKTGKELIEVYYNWEDTADPVLLDHILAHQHQDLIRLFQLTDLLDIPAFLKGSLMDIHTLNTEQTNGTLIITGRLLRPLRMPILFQSSLLELSVRQDRFSLTAPIRNCEMKLFYPGKVSDYYYLPEEDEAIHKSVARFVDPEHRKKASKQNCYKRYQGSFIPGVKDDPKALFKTAYDSPDYYRLLDEAVLSDRNELLSCLCHLLGTCL